MGLLKRIAMQSSNIYRLLNQRKLLILCAAVVLLCASLLLDLLSGAGNLSAKQLLTALFDSSSVQHRVSLIVWEIRLPIALMAVLVGAMLALAGSQMQTILNNPLADPFTLGISSAASLGAAIPIVFGVQIFDLPMTFSSAVSAFLFAMGATFLLTLFSRLRGASSETLVLLGIALLFAFNALLSLIQYSASDVQLSQIVFWMMGSLGRSNWMSVTVCFATLVFLVPLIIRHAWSLTAMRMGEARAESFGINVKSLRIKMLISISLLSATAVSFVGTIGFVGLVAPHIARMIVGEDQRFLIPMAMLCGGLLMSMTSILSKTVTPGVVYPVGMITALVGIPFFISLIFRSQQRSW